MVRRYLISQLAVITCDDAEHDVVKLVDFQFLWRKQRQHTEEMEKEQEAIATYAKIIEDHRRS